MTRTLFKIKNWGEHFEISQSRKVKRGALSWVALPTAHDGKGFRRVMLLPDGPAIFGAFVLIVEVAAKCSERGTLSDADGPLDAEDLAIKTGCPASAFERAFEVLTAPRIGWLLGEQWEPAGSELPPRTYVQDETRRDVRDEKAPGSKPPAITVEDVALPETDRATWQAALTKWLDYKRVRKQPYKATEHVSELLKKFPTAAAFSAAVDESISNNWSGAFPPKPAAGNGKPPGPGQRFDPTSVGQSTGW